MTDPTRRRISYFLTTDCDQPMVRAAVDAAPGSDALGVLQVCNVFGDLLLHRTEDLWVATEGVDRRLQELIRRRLLAERFDVDDAEEWAFRNWRLWLAIPIDLDGEPQDRWICDQVTSIAGVYRDTGMPNDEAFAWAIRSINANYAVYLRRQGWNPDTFGTLTGLCLESATDQDEAHWVAAPIVWWRVLRYLLAGMTLAEALAHEQRRLEGEDIDSAIDVLLALTPSDSHTSR